MVIPFSADGVGRVPHRGADVGPLGDTGVVEDWIRLLTLAGALVDVVQAAAYPVDLDEDACVGQARVRLALADIGLGGAKVRLRDWVELRSDFVNFRASVLLWKITLVWNEHCSE